jgi:hypothetical protein
MVQIISQYMKASRSKFVNKIDEIAWTNVPGARILASAAIPIQSPKTK